MAVTVFRKTALTGGIAAALDSVDGSAVLDGDLAFVTAAGLFYVYTLDDDSGAAEDSPGIIAPDTNAGTKRWILQAADAGSGTVTTDHIGESTAGHGVSIDGVLLKDSGISVDHIGEKTGGHGVTIDSALLVNTSSTFTGSAAFTGTSLIDTNASNVYVGQSTVSANIGNAVLAIVGSVAPSASPTNGIVLFAVDVAGSHELKVRDEAGNVTTLSPHAFTLFEPDPAYVCPWSYHSERDGVEINVDMYGAIQAVEQLVGRQFIYTKDHREEAA